VVAHGTQRQPLGCCLGCKPDCGSGPQKDLIHASKCGLGPPKVLKAGRGHFCVAYLVLDVAVSEVSLQGSSVVPSVCQRVTAGMPEHVWVGFEAKPRLDACAFDHAGEPCGREW
jgi:hypothetical protein